MKPVTYEVKTAVFEGPLDLLLQLITRRQVEITEISLIDLVDEYLMFLGEMERLDLEVTSEFVLIASTLIQLKARHLLPNSSDLDLDEELELMEERDRLLSRLLACVTFKDVAAVLAHRMEPGERFVPRTAGIDVLFPDRPIPVSLDVTADELARIASKVFDRRLAEPDLDHLDLDLPSVADAIADLRSRVSEAAVADFDTLVADAERPAEVVAYFLALLELARWGIVEVSQDSWLGRIQVRPTGVPDPTFETEWR